MVDAAPFAGQSSGRLFDPDLTHELDAVVAHLYGLEENHLVHIFKTFHEGWDYEERLRATLKHFHDWRRRQ